MDMPASALLYLASRGRFIFALTLLAASLALGCSEAAPPSATSTTPAAAPALSSTPTQRPAATPAPLPSLVPPDLPIGLTAPDFEFILFQGSDALGADRQRLSDLGGRPIVLNFWARYCGPCWKEMPELQDFYEESGEDVLLLGIDVGQFTGLGSPKDAGKLLDSLGVTYPAGYTDDERVVSMYRIRAMPTTIFIEPGGRVFRSWSGAIQLNQLESIVSEMMEEE